MKCEPLILTQQAVSLQGRANRGCVDETTHRAVYQIQRAYLGFVPEAAEQVELTSLSMLSYQSAGLDGVEGTRVRCLHVANFIDDAGA